MSEIINKWDLTPPTQSFFVKYGHQGKWQKSIRVGNGETTHFTGSDNAGVGGVIVVNADTTIHLSGGGTIPGSALNTNELYEFGVSKIVNGGSGDVYALVRNKFIRS